MLIKSKFEELEAKMDGLTERAVELGRKLERERLIKAALKIEPHLFCGEGDSEVCTIKGEFGSCKCVEIKELFKDNA